MIKYANIPDYTGLGEMGFFSHVYQWVQEANDCKQIIIVNAYEHDTSYAFKGYVIKDGRYYFPTTVIEGELTELEKLVGPITIDDDFNVFCSRCEALSNMPESLRMDVSPREADDDRN